VARQTIEERTLAVRVLLASLHDYLPSPPTSSGLIALGSLPGPAPGRRVPCSYCRRTGKILTRRGRRLCPVCRGASWRSRRGPVDNPAHPRYEEPWDEYTEQPVREAVSRNPEPMSARMLEVQLERLEREAALRAGDTGQESFGWERERILHDRKGSYQELRRSLHLLERLWPAGHRQVQRRYFIGVEIGLTPYEQIQVEAAEEWLARTIRGEIRVPPWLAEREAKRRQRSMHELYLEGLTAGAIARELRIPKRQVQRQIRAWSLSDGSGTIREASAPGASA
jgi:hypothetical protein